MSDQHPASRDTLETAALQDDALQALHTQLAREKSEPSESFAPVPLFLVVIFCVLFFWAGVYLTEHSGLFSGMVYDPKWKPSATAEAAPPPDPMKVGARVFTSQCASCHQATGLGQPGVYPPLAGSEWVLTGDGARPTAIVLKGLQGPIQVKGNSYNNVMAAFGNLRDSQIAALMTYIRGNPEWGNSAAPVTEEQVKAWRAEHAARGNAWTGPELLALYPIE